MARPVVHSTDRKVRGAGRGHGTYDGDTKMLREALRQSRFRTPSAMSKQFWKGKIGEGRSRRGVNRDAALLVMDVGFLLCIGIIVIQDLPWESLGIQPDRRNGVEGASREAETAAAVIRLQVPSLLLSLSDGTDSCRAYAHHDHRREFPSEHMTAEKGVVGGNENIENSNGNTRSPTSGGPRRDRRDEGWLHTG